MLIPSTSVLPGDWAFADIFKVQALHHGGSQAIADFGKDLRGGNATATATNIPISIFLNIRTDKDSHTVIITYDRQQREKQEWSWGKTSLHAAQTFIYRHENSKRVIRTARLCPKTPSKSKLSPHENQSSISMAFTPRFSRPKGLACQFLGRGSIRICVIVTVSPLSCRVSCNISLVKSRFSQFTYRKMVNAWLLPLTLGLFNVQKGVQVMCRS